LVQIVDSVSDPNSVTYYDDSDFPLTDSLVTYLSIDARNAKSAHIVMKNTSQTSIVCKILGSVKPTQTIPLESDPSWSIIHIDETIVGNAEHQHDLSPTWSWFLIQLKNNEPPAVGTAKVWVKIKLV